MNSLNKIFGFQGSVLRSRYNYCCHCFPIERASSSKYIHTNSEFQQAVVPKNLKGKSTSSQQWLKRHLNDPYVAKAKKLGYRARSAFKLLELDEKFKIFKPGQFIVECGAAPGAWTQVAVSKINSDGKKPDAPEGKIISVDLLDIEPIHGAVLLPASDFTEPRIQQEIVRLFEIDSLVQPSPNISNANSGNNFIIDGILSDMAPNASGFSETDHYRIVNLVTSALDFAVQHGKPGSFFVAKIFNGPDTQNLIGKVKKIYKSVKTTKPESSRENSSELFIVCKSKI